jgi:tetratricopeptide (TPR) repeat protein
MTLVLGRVAERRDRPREAARQLGLAAELAQRLGDNAIQARAQWALSRVRKAEGDGVGAVNALGVAIARMMDVDPRAARRALLEIELGELLAELGDVDSAVEHLTRALDLARDGEWGAIAATAMGVLGSVDELAGRRDKAAQRYRDAAVLAADSGDAPGRDRWLRASQSLRT